jgi:predicted RNase H-like nuclease (RuvC/YqgF family)
MVAVTPMLGGVMFELNRQIARLELRCEQLIIHLRTSDRNSEDAPVRKADLYSLLKELARVKRKREQLERSFDIPCAA